MEMTMVNSLYCSDPDVQHADLQVPAFKGASLASGFRVNAVKILLPISLQTCKLSLLVVIHELLSYAVGLPCRFVEVLNSNSISWPNSSLLECSYTTQATRVRFLAETCLSRECCSRGCRWPWLRLFIVLHIWAFNFWNHGRCIYSGVVTNRRDTQQQGSAKRTTATA